MKCLVIAGTARLRPTQKVRSTAVQPVQRTGGAVYSCLYSVCCVLCSVLVCCALHCMLFPSVSLWTTEAILVR